MTEVKGWDKIKTVGKSIINFIKKVMLKQFSSIVGWGAIFYFIGFLICLIAFIGGSDGSDMMTQHYRWVISLII